MGCRAGWRITASLGCLESIAVSIKLAAIETAIGSLPIIPAISSTNGGNPSERGYLPTSFLPLIMVVIMSSGVRTLELCLPSASKR